MCDIAIGYIVAQKPLYGAAQEMLIKNRWQAPLDQDVIEINYANDRGESYNPDFICNRDVV